MNLFAALTLSTRKQAVNTIHRAVVLFTVREAYRMVISDNDPAENGVSQPYRLEIFAVSYPHAQPGKGWGDPVVASRAHFSKKFSEEELSAFFEKHDWSLTEGWQPLENE